MAHTKISDVIVPEVFNPYVIQQTAERSALRQSGIIANIDNLEVPNGGFTVSMPFWNDLSGRSEVLSDATPLTPETLTASKDVAIVLVRGKAWSANDLAGSFAGSDPMRAAADLVATWWARDEQATLLSILEGVFASPGMTDNILDASGLTGNGAIITGSMLIDGISLLGDAASSLTGIVTHSAVLYDLAKKNLLDPKPTVPGVMQAPEINTFLGRTLIADDSAPKSGTGANTIYTTYVFGRAAVGAAEGEPPKGRTEYGRDALAGNDILINRRHFILHPRGVKWIGMGYTPSDSELAIGTNWERVYESKQIRIVAIKHKIGAV